MLKGTRYALLKHPERLKPGEARRLETLRRENRALDRAYELKEYLATILGQATPEDAPERNCWRSGWRSGWRRNTGSPAGGVARAN